MGREVKSSKNAAGIAVTINFGKINNTITFN